ncbi:MAG TPA: tetratricopeptide repeat protein [Gemmatimonadaceae bacterium]|nr:tetratricopeptide repeat protein [Gemmatimonadaceae bacterium]
MSNVDKLKKKAAEFEQKKQFDRALEVYLQIIEQTGAQDDRDVTVYNRVGDLYLRLNKTDQAVNYYEQAVDLYTDGGYLNNAIALCNKILRHAPQRHQIYYKLGKISAKKGFNSDAKKNFLEYADRMHRAGKDTDAFKALQEFADLCPGQDDIRLMLADQLAKAGKNAEAIEQLQILHESLDAEGRTAEAEATVQRMKSLDPNVEPRRSKTPVKSDSGGLVFLDVGASPVKPMPKVGGREARRPATPPRRPATPPHVQPPPEIDQLQELEPLPDFEPINPDAEPPLHGELTSDAGMSMELEPEIEPEPEVELEPTTIPGLEPTASGHDLHEASTLGEIEPTFDLSVSDVDISPLEGLESSADPTAFASEAENPIGQSGVEGLISSDSGFGVAEPGLGEPLSTEDPLAGLNILEDDRLYAEETPAEQPVAEREAHVAGDDVPAIESMELDIGHVELHEEPAEPEREPEEEEEPYEPEPVAARADEEEEEPDEQEIEEEVEEEEPAPPPKPTRPRLVEPTRAAEQARAKAPEPTRPKLVEQSKAKLEPLRMTRPKPKKGKTPVREESSSQRQPVNPFMRPRGKSKPSPKAPPRVATPPTEIPRAATPKENPPQRSDDNFVDLGDWLREDRGPRSTRMVAQEDHNRGEGEQADFTDMLEKFKAGVAANVDEEDFDSHYDLGIAYKEMGLIDEAIAEFQKALRGATQRIRAYEALGQCFIDRNEHDVAITVLGRALREPGMEDEDLIGVLYLLGFASEGSKKPRDAAAYYQRVFAIDIDFRDVSKRLKQMTKAASK